MSHVEQGNCVYNIGSCAAVPCYFFAMCHHLMILFHMQKKVLRNKKVAKH